jgi:hypothetical protein
MGCIKDSKNPPVVCDLELLVHFNVIESNEGVGRIVMFVKSIYIVYVCTFYWML